ncbi:MAG: hypothetical protein AAF990_20060 [Bacteroidota bacterium]
MLDALKNDLKNLVGQNKFEECFRRLKEEVLDQKSEWYNHTILIEGRYEAAKKDGLLQLITVENKDVSFNNVGQAILWVIDGIEKIDLVEGLQGASKEHVAIPNFHAFTVDRVDQNDSFQLHFYDPPPDIGKVRLFYLYGDAGQAMETLFRRLGMEIGGFLLNWEEGAYDPGVKISFDAFKPAVHRHPKLYEINIIKELLARFFPRINAQQPIRDKTIKDLLDSPELKDYTAQDMVFILLTMDDANWNTNTTPQVVRSLADNFLNADLPDTAPTFFFFFGIEYAKANAKVKEEVHQAILNRKQGGEILEELLPVSSEDIETWFSRYQKFLVEEGKSPSDMVRGLFGSEDKHDMNNIVIKLQQLIEKHNKGLVITAQDNN